MKKFLIRQVVRVIKFAIGMLTNIAHFDRKVGIYIVTKLLQFASREEPYAIQAGPDGFFWPSSRHRVRPSYRDFLNSFAMKARAGPYGSYDNVSYGSSFLPASRVGHESTGKNRSVNCSTDRENEVTKKNI